ncbi:RnfABCDGE type electron transport complex subunit D [Myxococcota bacterium]|nr:RnfABCDGE type electron transport complex subunit D [Myxococcota bacterium]
MSSGNLRLQVTAAPFAHSPRTTAAIMRDVILALLPAVAAAVWLFGIAAVLVLATAILGAVLTDGVFGRQRWAGLKDGSAVLTGLLLGLTLPPGIPLWMALLGGVVAIGLSKVVWGGLGHNLFNPALIGRAFLQAAFPTVLTSWVAPQPGQLFSLPPTTLSIPLQQSGTDVISAATPLGLAKFQHTLTDTLPLFTGQVAGSLGETSALLLLLGGAFLVWRRALDWRIPVSIFASVALFATLAWLAWPTLPPPQFMLFSGGLVLGAVYMATDPVSSPTTPWGAWIFGAGIGLLVVLIRNWGGLPEGVMYAILLMNAAAPLIERATQPRAFGRDERRIP